MRNPNRLIPVSVFLASFQGLLYGLCPTVSWYDSGELIASAYTLGIPHPSGYPIFAMLAKAATFLPFGEIAYKANLVAALFGSITLALSAYLFITLFDSIIGGLVPVLLFACAPHFLDFAISAEVYGLTAAFIVLLAIVVLKSNGNNAREIALVGFVFGLLFCAHLTAILIVPAVFAYYFFEPGRRTLRNIRSMAAGACAFILALSTLIYLPIRAEGNPLMNWGAPDRFIPFFDHYRGAHYSGRMFVWSKEAVMERIVDFGRILQQQFTWPGLTIGVVFALMAIARKPGRADLFFGLIFLCPLSFIFYELNPGFLMPSYIGLAYFIGRGFSALSPKLADGFLQRRPVFAIIPLLILGVVYSAAPAKKRDWDHTRRYVRDVIDSTAENSVLCSTNDDSTFPLWYIQRCENYRPDLFIISRPSVTWRGYLERIKTAYPQLEFPPRLDGGDLFFMEFVRMNANRYPIYWEPANYKPDILEPFLRRNGLVFRFDIGKGKEIHFDQARFRERFRERRFGSERESFERDPSYRRMYAMAPSNFGFLAERRGRLDTAIGEYEKALEIDPDNPHGWNRLGVLQIKSDDRDSARRSFRSALSLCGNQPDALINLGIMDLEDGNIACAIDLLESCASDRPKRNHNLAVAYNKIGRTGDALSLLEQNRRRFPDYAPSRLMLEEIRSR